jgi:hypothetical protein
MSPLERWLARGAWAVTALLLVLSFARAVTLEVEWPDNYSVRLSAASIAGDSLAPFDGQRSALLVLVEAPVELVAPRSRLAWVWPRLLGVAAYGGLALTAAALARRAGASELAALLAQVAVMLDRVAWSTAPLGSSDLPAAVLGSLGLLSALRLLADPSRRFVLETGALLGLAAATRPNVGVTCAALLVVAALASRGRGGLLARAAVACAVAVGVYLAVETAFFMLGLRAGPVEATRGHVSAILGNVSGTAIDHNHGHRAAGVYLRSVLAMEPMTALLAPFALVVAVTRGTLAARALALTVLVHAAFLSLLHAEPRYALPAMAPLAALVAWSLGDVVTRPRARVVLAAAWLAVPLALGLRFEARCALDPIMTSGFNRKVAAQVAALAPSGRAWWIHGGFYLIAPEIVVREGSPYGPGDPGHATYNLGPEAILYHAGLPALRVAVPAPPGPGVIALPRLAAAGDAILIMPLDGPLYLWEAKEPPAPLGCLGVRAGPDGSLRLTPLVSLPYR